MAGWLDGAFIVVGGRSTPACPPGASCVPPEEPPLRDGARFDPASQQWSSIADAPVPIANATSAIVNDVLYLWVAQAQLEVGGVGEPSFLAYDREADTWDALPLPDLGGLWPKLVAVDEALVAYAPSHESGFHPDWRYWPEARRWEALPADPLAPSFDRSLVEVDGQLVLLGLELVDNPGSQQPSLYQAAALELSSMTWRELGGLEVSGGYAHWFAVGNRIISPTLGGTDGGQTNNYGRTVPYGGILDIGTGHWVPLPNPPPDAGYHRTPAAGDEQLLLGGQEWAYQPQSGAWTRLPRPDGAADEGQAGAVGNGRYYIWGGARWSDSMLSSDGWVWSPGQT